LYDPYPLSADAPLPQPEGGGGTSFQPFFAALAQESTTSSSERLAVYLTDGYGDFLAPPPDGPVLWMIAPGGLTSEEFPFGEVARGVRAGAMPNWPAPPATPRAIRRTWDGREPALPPVRPQ